MKRKILLPVVFFFLLTGASAQQQQEKNSIRIVDTLSKQERASRTPVILKAELDSMIQLYNASHRQSLLNEPAREIVKEIPLWVMFAGALAILVIAFLLYLIFGYHRRLTRTIADLKRLIKNFDFYVASANTQEKMTGNKTAVEKRVSKLASELEKEKEANKSITQEYGLVKQAIAEVYKVRNYPFFDKEKNEGEIITDLLKTERAVALHEFEKFLKPVIAITDANKNNPAKISPGDSERLLELLISLSLYHIEYLYLRINELSVGGNIVQRIGSNGNGIDPALSKKLNMEHGSRALALRMALNKAGINNLSYPVFDETDLNIY